MILTDEEVDGRLESQDNLVNKIKVIQIGQRGKRGGDKDVPPEVKKLLGSLANKSDETGVKISEVFDITQESVSCYSRGLSSSAGTNTFDKDLAEAVKGKKEKKESSSSIEDKSEAAHEAALDCLVEALGLLAPKLKDIQKPKELAKIASDMSRAAGNLKKKEEKDSPTSNVQVVIFTPPMKTVNHYETVEA